MLNKKRLSTSVDRTELLKDKIQVIFNGCIFLLSNSKKELHNNKDLLFECSYETQLKDKKLTTVLLKEDIKSLRDRALLAKII